MSDPVDPGREMRGTDSFEPSVEAYETNNGTVLYEARNPLAWIESSRTVLLDEAA